MNEAGYKLLASHDLLAMQIFMVFALHDAAANGRAP